MKKTVSSVLISALLVCGCATHTQTVKAPDGTVTTTTDKQSDNTALQVVGQVVKIGGDVVTAVLPPLIPVIVGGVSGAITGSNTNAPVH